MTDDRELFHLALIKAIEQSGRSATQLATLLARQGKRRGGAKTREQWIATISAWRNTNIPRDDAELAPLVQLLNELSPTTDSRKLHALRERASRAPKPAGKSRARQSTPPRLLRPAPVGFVGRSEQKNRLDHLLDRRNDTSGTTSLVLIKGMPGVGKTALALHWGHSRQAQFPGGQFYLDLRGYSGDLPMTPAEAATELLNQLALPAATMPTSPGSRIDLVRRLLTNGRCLIIFDNVSSAEQIRGLLPANPHALVIVTSRDVLDSLPGPPIRLRLSPLSPEESYGLLAGVLSQARHGESFRKDAVTDLPPADLRELAKLCGNLPLALWIAGSRMAVEPNPQDVLVELREETRRLPRLSVSRDPVHRLRSVFAGSVRVLDGVDEQAGAAFRLLGVHPGPEYGTEAVAALLDLPVDRVRGLLTTLAGFHLVEPTSPGRCRQHDLLRLYAAELAKEDPVNCARAADRVMRWYLAVARKADRFIALERPPAAHVEEPIPNVLLDSRESAIRWLEVERVNMLASAEAAAEAGDVDMVCDIANINAPFYQLRKHWDEWIRTHTLAQQVAESAGHDQQLQRTAHNLANALFEVRRFDEALEHQQSALDLALKMENRRLEAAAHYMMGNVLQELRRFPEAEQNFRAASAIYTNIGETHSATIVEISLADVSRELGRFEEAKRLLERCMESLAGIRSLQEYHVLARWAFAVLLVDLGRFAEAEQVAGEVAREAGQAQAHHRQAQALVTLAQAHRGLGRYGAALHGLRAAAELLKRAGDHYLLGLVCLEESRCYSAMRDPEQALKKAERAAELLGEFQDPQARYQLNALKVFLTPEPG